MQHSPAPRVDRPALRPRLHPGAPVIWRSATCLQVGTRPFLRLSFEDADAAMRTARLLAGLDGCRTWGELMEHDALLMRLAATGLLLDAGVAALPGLAQAPERQAAEIGAVALGLAATPTASSQAPEAGRAARILHRRARARVQVRGDGRLAAALAPLLSASGVGHVDVLADACSRGDLVTDYDISPGIAGALDVGTSRTEALTHAVTQAAITTPDGHSPRPDLVVLARDAHSGLPWVDPEACADLVSTGVPHLVAVVAARGGRVGPFTVPGRTACQRCHALTLTDADPAWPMVAAHLIRPRRREVPPVSMLAATTVACVVADQVLAFLDDGLVLEGALDLDRTVISHRALPVHDRCGCTWRLDEAAHGERPLVRHT